MKGPRGSQLFVQSATDAPLVWFDLAIRGGAATDPVGTEGLHRHAALLARRGAGDRRRAEFDETLDSLGASIDINVSRDAIALSGLVLTRHIDKVIELTADLLAAPRFDDDEHERLQRETPQVLDEVRDDDSALATRWFDWKVHPGHPYARTSLGTEASLARITRDDAAAAWRREVVPRNIVLGFSGDVTEQNAADWSQRIVERLPDHEPPPLPSLLPPAIPVERRTLLVDKPDRSQAQLRFGHLSMRWGDADTAAMLIVETAFGGMFSSRLMQEIRVKRSWSYGAGCSLRRSRGAHWFEVWMATGIDATADAVALTQDMIVDLHENGLTEDEVTFAKSYLLGAMPFHTATARQRCQLSVRDAAYDLAPNFTAGMPTRLADVSAADVKAACNRWLDPSRLVTVAVTTASTTRAGFERTNRGPIEIVRHDEY